MLSQQLEVSRATSHQLEEEASKLRGQLRAERTRGSLLEDSNKTVSVSGGKLLVSSLCNRVVSLIPY